MLSVSPITLDELTEQHAKQENMSLVELLEVIKVIYPNESEFWVIEFKTDRVALRTTNYQKGNKY